MYHQKQHKNNTIVIICYVKNIKQIRNFHAHDCQLVENYHAETLIQINRLLQGQSINQYNSAL